MPDLQQALFQQKQFEFCAHLRDPNHVALPAQQEARRVKIYSDLLFNNLLGFVSTGFPVLKSFYSESEWKARVRQFFVEYRCHSPYFREIQAQFIDFLQNHYQPDAIDPPFLLELAHYEWVELLLDTTEAEVEPQGFDANGDLLRQIPVVSPLVYLLAYQWPVHKLDAENYYPAEPPEENTYLIVFRDRQDQVQFVEANPVTAKLLEMLQENKQSSGQQLLELLAEEIKHPQPGLVIENGLQTLNEFHQMGVLLGVKINQTE